MPRRIVIIQGHPDASAVHFGHALADAYAREAVESGHETKRIAVADLGFPLLRSKSEWDRPLPKNLQEAQDAIGWADHLVLLFPLWLGTMPALLKAFLEQVLRPGFAFTVSNGSGGPWKKALTGKSARIVVTMGMPAFWYRWYFLAHGVKGLERNILKFCGVSPVRETFIGMVEANDKARRRWLQKLGELGRRGR
jgi:putative NADPH-quinone reductase